MNSSPVIRKRGRHTPPAPPGYLRYVEAAKLFEPLDISSFAYRARVGDIESIDDQGLKAYKEESIIRIRDAILLETAAKQKEAIPQQLKGATPTLEERVEALEKEVRRLKGRIASLEAQLS
jgi:hypothetical protein